MITWNTQKIKKADDSLILLGFKGKFIFQALMIIAVAILLAILGSLFFSPLIIVFVSFSLAFSAILYMTDKYKKYGQHGLSKQARIMKLPKGIRNSIKIKNIINK